PGISFHQVLNQQRNVILPLAQRRDLNRENIKPVEKVLAECARAHSGFQVPVSRRYYADVDGNRLITPDPLQLSFLEYSQEGKLCLGRKLADLVKENRPAIGGFESSCASLKRPG